MSNRWIIWRIRKNKVTGFLRILGHKVSLSSTDQFLPSEFDPSVDKQIFCGYGGGDRPTKWTFEFTGGQVKTYASLSDARKILKGIPKHFGYDFGVDLHPQDRYND